MPPRARLLAAAIGVLALVAAGCGDDGGGGEGGGVAGSPEQPVTEVRVVSPDISYDLEQIYVPAGEEVTLTYENRDDGIAHNLRIKTDEPSSDQPATDLTVGPDTQTLTFALDPGEYTYSCDIHPNMRGTVTAG